MLAAGPENAGAERGGRGPMSMLRRLTSRAGGLALPRRPVRLRFTLLYGVLFLLSGAGLLAIVNLVASRPLSRAQSAPAPGQVSQPSTLAEAQARIGRLHEQLAGQQAAQSRQLLVGSAVALGVMMVLSVVLGRLVAARVLRPLRTMTAATRRISADNLHERLAVPGPADEVKDLADTIDDLLERLEAAFAAQRRFVANASHELRTPLATMRASLDVAVGKPEPVPAQTLTLAGRRHPRAAGRRDQRAGPRPAAGGAAGPAVPPARRRPHRLRQRGRARAVDRRGHRRGARRHPGPVRPPRRRPAGRHRAAPGWSGGGLRRPGRC